MEALVYAANFMYVAAYFTNHLLRLRLLTLSAAICLAAYFSFRAEPILVVAGWNLFFAALNAFQIARLLHIRRQTGAGSAQGYKRYNWP